MKKLLLLSNSTLPGEPFFLWPETYIRQFLGDEVRNILFFPFAGVTISFDDYYSKVRSRLKDMGYETESAHRAGDKREAIDRCDAIAVGGGNTFQLIKYLQAGWLPLIREKVNGGVPYFGWSAGANVACPSIKTTNDMPIIQPESFEALNLVSFQINPHYTEAAIPNHGGETRPDRIKEFLMVNRGIQVMGLPEGSLLEVEGDNITFRGRNKLKQFITHNESITIDSDSRVFL